MASPLVPLRSHARADGSGVTGPAAAPVSASSAGDRRPAPPSLDHAIAATVEVLSALRLLQPEIDHAAGAMLATLVRGGKLLVCGNGGSAAEAAHFATELVGRFALNRRPLPALALSADGSLLSCIANDFGYDAVFARQIAGLAAPGDLVVTFSSSGNSPTILGALAAARRLQLESVAFLGRGGGAARGLATFELIVPGDSGAAAQEAHLFLIHYFCTLIDDRFCG